MAAPKRVWNLSLKLGLAAIFPLEVLLIIALYAATAPSILGRLAYLAAICLGVPLGLAAGWIALQELRSKRNAQSILAILAAVVAVLAGVFLATQADWNYLLRGWPAASK